MRILFVTATRIGDAVLSTGLPRDLLERYPGAEFTIAAGPRAVDLRGSALTYLLGTRRRRVVAKGNPEEHRVRQFARLFDLEPPPAPVLCADRAGARGVPQARLASDAAGQHDGSLSVDRAEDGARALVQPVRGEAA